MDRAGLLRWRVSGEQAPGNPHAAAGELSAPGGGKQEDRRGAKEDPARAGVLGICCFLQVRVASHPAQKTKVV
jgi:hypothetical protein